MTSPSDAAENVNPKVPFKDRCGNVIGEVTLFPAARAVLADFFQTPVSQPKATDPSTPVSQELLDELGFRQIDGGIPGYKELRIGDWTIETGPEFTNREGRRRWNLLFRDWGSGAIPSPLKPRNRMEVMLLINRLKEEVT